MLVVMLDGGRGHVTGHVSEWLQETVDSQENSGMGGEAWNK